MLSEEGGAPYTCCCVPRCRQTPQGSTLPPAVPIRISPFLTSPQASVWPPCSVTQVRVASASLVRTVLLPLSVATPQLCPSTPGGTDWLKQGQKGLWQKGMDSMVGTFPSPCPASEHEEPCEREPDSPPLQPVPIPTAGAGRNLVRSLWQFIDLILYSLQRLSLA